MAEKINLIPLDAEEANPGELPDSLIEFLGPIYQTSAKRGYKTTTVVHDPQKEADMNAKAAEMNAKGTAILEGNKPSFGERLLGGVQGAVSGAVAGGAIPGALGADEDGAAATVGQVVGGALGGYAGASSDHPIATGAAVGKIAENAVQWQNQTRQKQAEDAVASASERMGQLNHPRTPEEAAQFAQEKDNIVNGLSQSLVEAGVAPDKAVTTAQRVAAINDPGGRYADSKTQAAQALADYYAIPAGERTEQDKTELRTKLNSIVIADNVAKGKLPTNTGAVLFGSDSAPSGESTAAPQGGGGPAPAPSAGMPPGAPTPLGDPTEEAPEGMEIEPVDPETGEPTGDPYMSEPVPPSGSGGAPSADDSGGEGDSGDDTGTVPTYDFDPTVFEPVPLPQTNNTGVLGKVEAVNTSKALGAELMDYLDSGNVPSGPVNGKSFDIYQNGTGGGGVGAGGVSIPMPRMGQGQTTNDQGNPFLGGNPIVGASGGNHWVDENGDPVDNPEEVAGAMNEAYSLAVDVARAGIAAKQGRSVNQITLGEIQAEVPNVWDPHKSNEQNMKNLERYMKDLSITGNVPMGTGQVPKPTTAKAAKPPKKPPSAGVHLIN